MASEHHRLPPAQPHQAYATLADIAVPAKAHRTDAVICIKPLFSHFGQTYLQSGLTAMVQSSVLLIRLWPLKERFKRSMNIPSFLH